MQRRCYGVAVTRAAATGAALAIVLAIGGCSSSSDQTSATASTSGPVATSTSAAPTTADQSQAAESLAVALVPDYLRTIDDLYLDPSRPLDDVYAVAVAPEATAEATAIGTFRSQGYRQVGRSQLVSASADSVDLRTDPAASPSPALPTVVVTACVDVSHVQATDASGTSVVPPGRLRYLIARLTVVNAHYPDASAWRVSEAPNRQAQSCDG
jgi:hypothetical protein